MPKNLFRNELSKLQPYVPGKPIEEVQKEYGLTHVVKLASNENQLGPSPKAVEAVKNELKNLNVYPDAGAMELRRELAKKYGLDLENIVVGNGGEQVLQIIAQTFINPGDEAIMAKTTFGIYANSVAHMGGIPVKLPLKDYKHDFEAFVENINERVLLANIIALFIFSMFPWYRTIIFTASFAATAFAYFISTLIEEKIGGMTGDTCGAVTEISQIMFMITVLFLKG